MKMAQNIYNNPKNPKQRRERMKKKALILVLVCAMAIMGLGVGKASAALSWYTCTVKAGGPSGTTINPANPPNTLIRLTENGSQVFVDKWFKLPDDRAKEMLATALTAMASDISVTISTDMTGTYPYVQAIYLVKVPQ
jgi:hypothetical protein